MNCATVECSQATSGKSKYCSEHRAIAREKWLEMVKIEKAKRATREIHFESIFGQADFAGTEAGKAHNPTPMVVQECENQLDDSSKVVQEWNVPDGVCGFAWITIRPANCAAAHYAKKHYRAQKAYYGGIQIWVHQFGQSYERKSAYADAFAQVLKEDGIPATAGGRLD